MTGDAEQQAPEELGTPDLQREVERWIAGVATDGSMAGAASQACRNIVGDLERRGRAAEEERDKHMDETVIGSPAYIAAQLAGELIDCRAELAAAQAAHAELVKEITKWAAQERAHQEEIAALKQRLEAYDE